MAQSYSNSGNSTSSVAAISCAGDEVKGASAIFHDFLGKGSAPDSSTVVGPAAGKVRPPSEASPSVSVSLGASSGGGRGPISTTSDLGSGKTNIFSNNVQVHIFLAVSFSKFVYEKLIFLVAL